MAPALSRETKTTEKAQAESGWPHPYIDVILTGLVIKPLHDLIANLQAAKKAEEDPKTTGAAGA